MVLSLRNQQFEAEADEIGPLGSGFNGSNFPLRKTGKNDNNKGLLLILIREFAKKFCRLNGIFIIIQ